VYCYEKIFLFIGCFFIGFVHWSQSQTIVNITDYGAISSDTHVNTSAIQSAIDFVTANGGGKVIIPQGTFVSGTIYLKSNVELHLEENATLLGNLDYFDYKKTARWYGLIGAISATNIAITGKGTIDGRGGQLAKIIDDLYHAGTISDPSYNTYRMRPSENIRPLLVEFGKCDGITIKDVTMKNSSCYVQAYYDCSNLLIDNIRVESTAFWNNDGMDIVDCKNVVVQNSYINSSDDGICIKSRENGVNDNITIRNCKVRSSASAVKFGTTSFGVFKNVVITDIEVFDTFRSAIAIETVDGANIENVEVSNIVATNTGNAIFMRIGHRKGTKPGYMRNVLLKNIQVQVPVGKPDKGYPMEGPVAGGKYNLIPSSIVGLDDSRIEDVVLDNIQITFGGGGKTSVANIPLDQLQLIPEKRTDYPEFSMFGELPATGFFVRNVNNITMKNMKLTVVENDFRPSLVFDKVSNLRIEETMFTPTNSDPQIILNKTVNGYEINSISATTNVPELIKSFGATSIVDVDKEGRNWISRLNYADNRLAFYCMATHSAKAQISIYNSLGSLVMTKNISLVNGANHLCLGNQELFAGVYLCKIYDGSQLFAQKFAHVK
jgi:hypothetical protein